MNNKTPEEIVRLLRDSCSGCDPTPCCEFEVLGPAAADLIESLQAQLAESQHREQAAVKQIEQKMIFDAGMGREPCEICANAEKTPCIHCEPKWRGPQAGKGDAE